MDERGGKIGVRSPDELLAEYHHLLEERGRVGLGRVKGALAGLDLRHQAGGGDADVGVLWILRAQQGTLEKLAAFLPAASAYSSVDLLATARNLFENLVWLKLFLLSTSWGAHFYGQFLQNQIEDIKGMIAKLEAEVNLFKDLEQVDGKITDEILERLSSTGHPSKDEIAQFHEERNRRETELDRRARRTFSLFAAAATFNGYGFQAHLLETKEIPRWKEQLQVIEQHMADFKAQVGDDAKFMRYVGKWQWRNEADRVGMTEQYDFLYRLTSRLLHATPMNIITEKELQEGERIMLLEYIVVTTEDVLDAIDAFDFPGRLDMIAIDLLPDDVGPE